ncbi:isochorismatase family protein [Methylobacterium sp. J-070]|uniref:isochorismatase family protein n=1 Tax=Methylobacterium sp. J-070 TaxID=2836650 RepID=UPI001FB86C9F|nr:isochorismatase family protein [Methylobacterium sp. J-070]MCJ2052858.1 isochorismatase family protein [Methylobacterium sp. J-070]
MATLNACLDAMAAGYAVHLPVDATGGLPERTEAAALRQVERAGGVVTCVRSLASRLAPDFAVPPGLNVFATLQAGLPT